MSRSSSAERRAGRGHRAIALDPRLAIGIALLGVFIAHGLRHLEIDPLHRLDAFFHDARVRLFAREPVDERIVIVDIDERSLAELGRWPWSRARLADLVERIFSEQGALLLGIDMILAEADESSGLASLEALARGPLRGNADFRKALEELRPALDYDGRLAAVLRRHPVVLGFHLSSGEAAVRVGELPAPLATGANVADPAARLTQWTGYGSSLPILQRAATGSGFLSAPVDPDGVTRRALLIAAIDGRVYGALSLVIAQLLIGSSAVDLHFAGGSASGGALAEIRLHSPRGSLRVPTDGEGAALLSFRGGRGSFAYHSAAEVLTGRLAAGSLQGRVVLLGTTAPGLLDQRVTPVGEAFPGVEAHANLLSGLLDERLVHRPSHTPALEAGCLLLVGIGLLWGLPRLSPPWSVAATLLLMLLFTVASLLAWAWAGLALPMAAVLVLAGMLLVVQLFFGSFMELRARRHLAALFGQYVPPELVDEMSRDPANYSMDGRNAELTVLFADLRGFTTLAETMPADELARMMNDYFSVMTEVIRRHRGTLDKYIGDEIVAFWGAPVADEQHARHAVEAGREMLAALAGVNRRFAARGWPALQIGIGINTGTMVVGDLGSRHRRSYTVLGDAVNLASRFQGLSKEYGVAMIIGEATREALGGVPCRQLDCVAVRGRAVPVAIHEPLGW